MDVRMAINASGSWPRRTAGFGFVSLSNLSVPFWKKKTGCDDDDDDDVSGWVLQKTIDLGKLLSLSSTGRDDDPTSILGFSEDHIVMFLKTYAGDFMIHLKSMVFKKLPENNRISLVYPFTSVYATGMSIGDGDEQCYGLYSVSSTSAWHAQ